jgi:hypothetical protein
VEGGREGEGRGREWSKSVVLPCKYCHYKMLKHQDVYYEVECHSLTAPRGRNCHRCGVVVNFC